jgi:cold shock protein
MLWLTGDSFLKTLRLALGEVVEWMMASKLGENTKAQALEQTDEAALDVFEVAGTIKWFDIGKGYGFIIPDDQSQDILLHVTCLRRDGYVAAYEGARIVCEVLRGARGLQALRILSMDESQAVHPSQMPPPRTHVTVKAESGFEKAEVKWFNRTRGFGFLCRPGVNEDIFIHMETLRRFGLAELKPGQMVWVRFGQGEKGLMAAEIRPLEGGGPVSH